VVGGQHGDEPLARRAVAGFAEALFHGRRSLPAGLELAFLADLNPDGAILDQRKNARGIDLNRDHQRLEAAETRALHRFVRAWRPGLVIDVHTYPPRRRHLTRRGKAYCHDVFVAGPTHPACLRGAAGEASRWLRESVIRGLCGAGYRSQRYTLIRPRGRVRHSTLGTHDSRNWLALRHGIQSLLLEGRQPRRSDPKGDRRTELSLQIALFEACRGALGRLETAPPPRPGEELPLRCVYAPDGSTCRLELMDLSSGRIEPVELEEEFRPVVEVRRSTRLPRAYAVPRRQRRLLELLEHHGFPDRAAGLSEQPVERFHIERAGDARRSRSGPKGLVGSFERTTARLDDHRLFPVASPGGRALATLLEPESAVGLARWQLFDVRANDHFPILRVP
ncbi:MAG: hypothetical protein MI919_13030, partial [Holophagales bacterium]|nr:hypothetical protein [Holophagales bacterium]